MGLTIRRSSGVGRALVGYSGLLSITHDEPEGNAIALPTEPMLQQTRTVSVIFVVVADPVGSGFVGSLARPGGNAICFTVMEPTTSAKWLELLKAIAPRVNRAAFLFNPATAPFAHYYLTPFNAAAVSLGLEAMTAPVHSKPELESGIATQSPDTGLISMPEGFLNVHREERVLLAARYRLPMAFFSLTWWAAVLRQRPTLRS